MRKPCAHAVLSYFRASLRQARRAPNKLDSYSKRSGGGLAVAVLLCFVSPAFASNSATLLRTADRSIAEHRYNEARSLYEEAMAQGIELDKDVARARNLATAYLRGTPPDPAQGIRWLRLVVAQDPQADGTRLELAKVLRHQGDLPAAISTYRMLVEAHPQSAEYVTGLAATLREAGQNEEAIQVLHTHLERNPGSLRVRLELGRQLNFSQQFVEAKQQFRTVLAADPHNLFAELGLAKANSFAGDQEGALEIYDRILQRQPGWYDAQVGKAFALLWSGHKEAAYDLLRKAQQRHPEDEEVRAALAGHGATIGQLRQGADSSAKATGVASTRGPAVSAALRSPTLGPRRAAASAPAAAGDSTPSAVPSLWPPTVKYVGGGFLFLILASLALRLAARHRNVSVTAVTTSREDIAPLAPAAQSDAGSLLDDQLTSRSAPADRAISAADGPTQKLGRNQDVVDPLINAADPEGKPEADPVPETHASSRRRVLLVGGTQELLEFQCAWLAAHGAEANVEGNWLPALVRLLNAPPDVLVLNGTTSDGWSSPRMFASLLAQSGTWAGPTLIVVGRHQATQLLAQDSRDAEILIEPFTGRQWEQIAQILLSGNSAEPKRA